MIQDPNHLKKIFYQKNWIHHVLPVKLKQGLCSWKKIPAFCNVFRAFIKEWLALRPIDQSRLLGKPLQLPLSLELCFLKDSVNHSTEVCTFLFIWFFSLHSSFAYEQDIFKSSYVSFSKEIQYICMIHSNIYLCNDTKSMGMYSRSQGYYNVLKRVSPCDFHHQKTAFFWQLKLVLFFVYTSHWPSYILLF